MPIVKKKNLINILLAAAMAFFVVSFVGEGIDLSLGAKKSFAQGAERGEGAMGEFDGGNSIIEMLKTLKNIKLDLSFFDDEVFRGLNDYSVELKKPETKGRENPFASF